MHCDSHYQRQRSFVQIVVITNIAAIPIYGKTHLIVFYSWTTKRMNLVLIMLGLPSFFQVMILDLPWPTSGQGQIGFKMHLNVNLFEKFIF